MSDWDDELQDILDSAKHTRTVLQEAVSAVDFAIEHSDEDASNDTFYALVQMLRKLRVEGNICIETLVEEALQDE